MTSALHRQDTAPLAHRDVLVLDYLAALWAATDDLQPDLVPAALIVRASTGPAPRTRRRGPRSSGARAGRSSADPLPPVAGAPGAPAASS